jgi:hypothetical protein
MARVDPRSLNCIPVAARVYPELHSYHDAIELAEQAMTKSRKPDGSSDHVLRAKLCPPTARLLREPFQLRLSTKRSMGANRGR